MQQASLSNTRWVDNGPMQCRFMCALFTGALSTQKCRQVLCVASIRLSGRSRPRLPSVLWAPCCAQTHSLSERSTDSNPAPMRVDSTGLCFCARAHPVFSNASVSVTHPAST